MTTEERLTLLEAKAVSVLRTLESIMKCIDTLSEHLKVLEKYVDQEIQKTVKTSTPS